MIFTVETILNNVLSDLPARSRDVVLSRFGIGKREAETLEAIGQRYSITRERVRQIEADALKSIKEKRTQGQFAELIGALEGFVREHGSVMDEAMVERLFARAHFNVENHREWEGLVTLLLTVGSQFKRAPATEIFSIRWYIEEDALAKQEEIAQKAVEHFKKIDKV